MEIFGSKDLAEILGIRPFKQRLPWIGPDLQTMKNNATAWRLSQVSGRATRHLIPCVAGDLSALLNTPLRDNAKGVVILCPGLGGSERSSYVREYAAALVPSGFATLRWNFRGAGPSAATSTGPYNAGLSDDLRAVITHLPKDVGHLPIYLLGFSLGGHLVLRTMGEGKLPSSVMGGLSISAPLNLSAAMKFLERPRNAPYMKYLVKKLQRDLDEELMVKAAGLKDIREIDNVITGPAFGYKDAEDYYENRMAYPLISKIKEPVMAIHSADDPWIPSDDYRSVTWPINPKSLAVVTKNGGHVGFHGAGETRPWALDLMLRYFNYLHATGSKKK